MKFTLLEAMQALHKPTFIDRAVTVKTQESRQERQRRVSREQIKQWRDSYNARKFY